MVSSKPSKTSTKPQPKTQADHFNAVLIEGLRSDFKFVIEKVDNLETSLTKRMDERFVEVNQQLADHSIYIKEMMKILAHHTSLFEKNDKRWDQNDKRWDQNDKRLVTIEATLDGTNKRLDTLEVTVDRTEKRLGTLEVTVDGTNKRLDTLEITVKQMDQKLDHFTDKVESHDQQFMVLHQKVGLD